MDNEPTKQNTQSEEKNIALLKQKLKQARFENRLTVELAKNSAKDFETAALLAKARMKNSQSADVSEVVKAIKNEKPFLFASSLSASARTQPLKVLQERKSQIQTAASQAAKSGKRTDILEYMRAKRSTK